MFLKITQVKTKQGIRKHAKIVESFWDKENSMSRQRIVMNLGPVTSDKDLQKYKDILVSMKEGKGDFFKKSELIVMETKEFGITYTVGKLLEKYSIDRILKDVLSKNNAKFDVYSTIKALIINRLIKPSSELSSYDWIKNDYLEKLDVKQHNLYRALDYLIKGKEWIEKKIFDQLKDDFNLNLNKVHYDLTSSYFEGKMCEIAFYGYSRDHRKDRKQIVIALVMCDGIPVYHEVYNGNTVDKTTLEEMIENLKKKLGLEKATIVADGGLLTKDNLEMLEDKKQSYILGVPRRNNKSAAKYLTKKVTSKKNQSARIIGSEVVKREGKEYDRKYILCLDKNTRKERLQALKEIKARIEGRLKELQDTYAKSQAKKKGKKMTKESMINQAYKILGKNKRLFEIKEAESKLNVSFKKGVYEYEKKIAGKFLIITNTNSKAGEIMKSYKELQAVENAFDEIKNFLGIRGIYHWKEHRVRAHVFICVLSFLVESIIEKLSNESARETLKKLRRIQITKIKIGKSIEKRLTQDSLLATKDIFKKIRIKYPNMIILETKK